MMEKVELKEVELTDHSKVFDVVIHGDAGDVILSAINHDAAVKLMDAIEEYAVGIE